jgi:uncharacterized protein (TIGR02001 family)
MLEKKMKKMIIASLIVLSTSALAGMTFNLGATTDYVYRGVSYSAHNSAIQGGADYSSEMGPLLSVWTSTLESGSAGQEIDLIFGYKHEIASDFSATGKIIAYQYLATPWKNYLEGNLVLNFRQLAFNFYYAPKTRIEGSSVRYKNYYWNLAYALPLAKDLTLTAAFGYSVCEKAKQELADSKNYFDGLITLSKTLEEITLSMNYSDTNRKNHLSEKQKDHSFFVSGLLAF